MQARTSPPGHGAAPDAVERGIASLGRLADLFRRRRTALAAEVGLSEAEWRVLEEIATEHFLPSLFARDRECSPAAVSKLLRGLAERGIVAAQVGADDARRRPYRLTARGGALLARLRASRRRAIGAIWHTLPDAEVARFADFADELAGRMEAWLGAGGGRGSRYARPPHRDPRAGAGPPRREASATRGPRRPRRPA
jgi:DNA-binding MarR family transcriptional regulator